MIEGEEIPRTMLAQFNVLCTRLRGMERDVEFAYPGAAVFERLCEEYGLSLEDMIKDVELHRKRWAE